MSTSRQVQSRAKLSSADLYHQPSANLKETVFVIVASAKLIGRTLFEIAGGGSVFFKGVLGWNLDSICWLAAVSKLARSFDICLARLETRS